MNPENIPLNAMIVGPANSGKTRHLVNLLTTTFPPMEIMVGETWGNLATHGS